jgi:hypothetical protein
MEATICVCERERERELSLLTLYNNLRSNLEFEEYTVLCTEERRGIIWWKIEKVQKRNSMVENRGTED